jgi:hypothetical protein
VLVMVGYNPGQSLKGTTVVRSWIGACLCIFTLFLSEGKAQIIFGSGPNHYLNGINAVHYSTYFESGSTGPRCAIDGGNWTIAVKFLVNQSAKLKFIEDLEYQERLTELSAKASLLAANVLSSEQGLEKFAAAQKELEAYGSIPRLRVTFTPIELQSGCAGTLEGELEVDVAPTEIIATKARVIHPTVVIWTYGHTLKGPQESFSSFMISSGEQLIKKFVNSWTEAQKL